VKNLQQYLTEFSLTPSHDLGTIVWRCNNGLQLGIIVGRDDIGNKYVIHNNNNRLFDVSEIDVFSAKGYSFRDANNDNHKELTAHKAFLLLEAHNKFNKQTYREDFKFEVPYINEIGKEPIGFTSGVNQVIGKSMALDKAQNSLTNTLKSAGSGLMQLAQLFGKQLKPQPLAGKLKTA